MGPWRLGGRCAVDDRGPSMLLTPRYGAFRSAMCARALRILRSRSRGVMRRPFGAARARFGAGLALGLSAAWDPAWATAWA